jgi:hypothetical protein
MAARIVQQHQSEKPKTLRFRRIDLTQHAGEPDRLGAQFLADQCAAAGCKIAFVENQIDHRLNRGAALVEPVLGRNLVGDMCVLDLAFGSHQPLRQGWLRHQEGARNLVRCQAAESAQGKGDLRLTVECGMAAGEDQPQPVVGKCR